MKAVDSNGHSTPAGFEKPLLVLGEAFFVSTSCVGS